MRIGFEGEDRLSYYIEIEVFRSSIFHLLYLIIYPRYAVLATIASWLVLFKLHLIRCIWKWQQLTAERYQIDLDARIGETQSNASSGGESFTTCFDGYFETRKF